MSRPEEGRPEEDLETRGRVSTAQVVVIALLLVGLLVAVFVIQNTRDARIEFLVWSVTMPLAGALLLAAVLGGIFGFLVTYLRQRQFRQALRRRREPREPGMDDAGR
jgi:uncharacterized integral membrane protein